MSIISSSTVIFLLCIVSLSSTSSSASRAIGVMVKQGLPQNTTSQDPMKNLKKVNEERKEGTIMNNINSSQVINATKLSHKRGVMLMNKKRKMRSNKQDQGHNLKHAINKHGRRQGHGTRRSHTKNLGKFPKVVSWRVPKSQDEMPQTGFNLDYAPPKVHPPTHN